MFYSRAPISLSAICLFSTFQMYNARLLKVQKYSVEYLNYDCFIDSVLSYFVLIVHINVNNTAHSDYIDTVTIVML